VYALAGALRHYTDAEVRQSVSDIMTLLKYNRKQLNSVEAARISSATDRLFEYRTPSWQEALAYVKALVDEKPVHTEARVLDLSSDKALLEVFKARIPADLRIRRLRLYDVLNAASVEVREQVSHLVHLDYITAANITIYGMCFGSDAIRDLRHTGILNSRETFEKNSKLVSTWAKRLPVEAAETKQKLAELPALLGYQQLPYPGFDLNKEAAGLAAAGEEHGIPHSDWERVFDEKLDKLMKPGIDPTRPRYLTLDDFIKEGKWLTAGSSSVGSVRWTWGEERGKFKARKNMLTEIYTDEELISLATKWDGVLRSRSIIKSELGKVRLAVASNIEAYLNESYFAYLVGHPYRKWAGMTLDEKPKDQLRRMATARKMFSEHCYSLPFDYAGFDHQPSTLEVQRILAKFFGLARGGVPADQLTKFDQLLDKVICSYARSKLLVRQEDGTTRELNVTGGLPTGVRVTSIVGNIWNLVMTDVATDLAADILGYRPGLQTALRGDDSLVICNSAAECYLVRLGYAAINAVGNNKKFSITQSQGEFLRTQTNGEESRGWVVRAIPSLTQRKPWNAEPWNRFKDVETVCRNIRLLERRLGNAVEPLHHANKKKWSKSTKQSYLWLELPVRMGGLGLYSWRGWTTRERIPPLQKPKVTFEGLHPRSGPVWAQLSQEEEALYSQAKMLARVSADDVPGTGKILGTMAKKSMAKVHATWRKVNVPLIQSERVDLPNDQGGEVRWPAFRPRVLTASTEAGWPQVGEFIREYKTVSEVKTLPSLGRMLKDHYPAAFALVKSLETNGWHRTDAIDLALGGAPMEPTKGMHPELSAFVKEFVVRDKGALYWKGRRNIAVRLYRYCSSAETYILGTTLAKLYKY
jgi:hypothetical protein